MTLISDTLARTEFVKTGITLLLFLMLLLFGCESKSQNTTTAGTAKLKEGWKFINADGKFTFHIPENMQKQDIHGIDSCAEEYRDERMRVSFYYGIYSDPLEKYSRKSEYKDIKEVISGTAAKIVYFKPKRFASEYRYYAAVHFPGVEKGKIKLTMIAEFNDEQDWEIARTIFESIYFD